MEKRTVFSGVAKVQLVDFFLLRSPLIGANFVDAVAAWPRLLITTMAVWLLERVREQTVDSHCRVGFLDFWDSGLTESCKEPKFRVLCNDDVFVYCGKANDNDKSRCQRSAGNMIHSWIRVVNLQGHMYIDMSLIEERLGPILASIQIFLATAPDELALENHSRYRANVCPNRFAEHRFATAEPAE